MSSPRSKSGTRDVTYDSSLDRSGRQIKISKNNFEEFTQAFEVRFVRIIFFLFLRISANAKNYRNKSYSTKLFSFMSWQITISEYFNFCIWMRMCSFFLSYILFLFFFRFYSIKTKCYRSSSNIFRWKLFSLFYFTLYYFISFYFVSFCFISFHFILFYFILF